MATPPSANDTAQIRADFERYARLIEPRLAGATFAGPVVESASRLQVERGVIFPQAMTGTTTPQQDRATVERLIELGRAARDSQSWGLAVVDAAGHRRASNIGLLFYAWLQAFRVRYETLAPSEFGRWEGALRDWCDYIEPLGVGATWGKASAGNSAMLGEQYAAAAWIALALHVAGNVFVREAWTDLAGNIFQQLADAQRDT